MDFAGIAARIQAGDQAAEVEFVEHFEKRLKYLILRQVRSDDYADIAHDVLFIMLTHIRQGLVRDPERIPAYMRTVALREVAYWIWKRVHSRTQDGGEEEAAKVIDMKLTPEQQVLLEERRDIMRQAMSQLKERDREILTRFYILEQKPEQICREMTMSPLQFRLYKNRAKNKFGDIGKRLTTDKEQILMRLAGKSEREKKAA